jgi:hypothetical protein
MVVIPWREQPSRVRLLDAVRTWYADHDLRTVLVDSDRPMFNVAAARNAGVAIAKTPVVIVNDADTIPEIGPLDEAIAAAATSGMTHLPYEVGGYRVVGARSTRDYLLRDRPLIDCEYSAFDFSCSGVFVTTPAAWASHFGHDALFEGWAPEDFAWRLTHEALIGQVPRHAGKVYALHHEAADRTYGSDDGPGALRFRRYLAAEGDVAALTALASEHLRRPEADVEPLRVALDV